MKRICILQNSMTFGGTDTFVINLCKGLVRDGHYVTVVLSVDKEEKLPREQDLLSTGVRVVKTCNLSGVRSKIRHLRLLYRELKKENYDCFQANIDLFNGPQMLISWLARVPVRECHSHNTQQGKELSEGRTFLVRLYQSLMRWMCWKFSNRYCGCSEQALDFLFPNKWEKDVRAKVIHNGINIEDYKKNIDRENKRNELCIGNRFVVSTIGRISHQKNPEFLLEVFYELCKIRNDVDLVWCGTGEDGELINRKINEYGLNSRIHMLGMRSDIPEILCVSNVFLLPSRFEGLGIVLVEAQAAGLPCVISDVIPKQVDCGLCLPISLQLPAKEWAFKTSDVLDNKIGIKLNYKKINQYSVETMVKEMEEVFEE